MIIFPFLQLPIQIHIVNIVEKLIRLNMICLMWMLNFPVQSRRSGPDIFMSNSPIFNVEMKASLQFVPVISSAGVYPEWKCPDHQINKPYCRSLIVSSVNLHRSYGGGCEASDLVEHCGIE